MRQIGPTVTPGLLVNPTKTWAGSPVTVPLSCRYEFPAGPEPKAIELEIRRWASAGGAADASAALFYGSDGFMAVTGRGYQTWIGSPGIPGAGARAARGPQGDFIDELRGHGAVHAEGGLEDRAVSTLLVHLAVVAHCLGRPVAFDPASRSIAGDPQAEELLAKLQAVIA